MIGQNIQMLIDEVKKDSSFQYLCTYNFQFFDMGDNRNRGPISSTFVSQDDYIWDFCNSMPYFPSAVYHDQEILTSGEIAECKNYIIATLFIGSCLNEFVKKYLGNDTVAKEKFFNFSVADHAVNFINPTMISFSMVDKDTNYRITVSIHLPAFTVNHYEMFNDIKTFLEKAGRFELGIVGTHQKSVGIHSLFEANKFTKEFVPYLQRTIERFKNQNQL